MLSLVSFLVNVVSFCIEASYIIVCSLLVCFSHCLVLSHLCTCSLKSYNGYNLLLVFTYLTHCMVVIVLFISLASGNLNVSYGLACTQQERVLLNFDYYWLRLWYLQTTTCFDLTRPHSHGSTSTSSWYVH